MLTGILGSLCVPASLPPISPSGPPGRGGALLWNCIFSSLCLSPAAIRHLSPPPAPLPGWRLHKDSWGEGEMWSVWWLLGGWWEWVVGPSGAWGKLGVPPPCQGPWAGPAGSKPSPALSLAWLGPGGQTLPGRNKLSWGQEGGTAQAGLQRGGCQEEEEERWSRLRGPLPFKSQDALVLFNFGPTL